MLPVPCKTREITSLKWKTVELLSTVVVQIGRTVVKSMDLIFRLFRNFGHGMLLLSHHVTRILPHEEVAPIEYLHFPQTSFHFVNKSKLPGYILRSSFTYWIFYRPDSCRRFSGAESKPAVRGERAPPKTPDNQLEKQPQPPQPEAPRRVPLECGKISIQ